MLIMSYKIYLKLNLKNAHLNNIKYHVKLFHSNPVNFQNIITYNSNTYVYFLFSVIL